jgi:DNA-binding GntR family transcriptional regulator
MQNTRNINRFNEDLALLPIKEKIYEIIKGKIIDFSYKPGQQLIEQNLSNKFGVSKSPVREAFQRLEGDGLVHLIPYKGAYVTALSMQEFKEICQLREALEVFCLEKGMISYSKEDIEDFKKTMELFENKLERKEEMKAIEYHFSFHYLIVKKLNNKLIENTYAKIHGKMERYLLLASKVRPKRLEVSNTEHYGILEAMENGNVSCAVDELKKHLSHVVETLTDDILQVLP